MTGFLIAIAVCYMLLQAFNAIVRPRPEPEVEYIRVVREPTRRSGGGGGFFLALLVLGAMVWYVTGGAV